MGRSISAACICAVVLLSACTSSTPSNVAVTTPTPSGPNGAQQGGGIAATPSPSPTPSINVTPSPDDDQAKGPADVIYEYYASINSKDFRAAYELWSDNGAASKKTFEQFRDGFRDTERTEVIIGTLGEEEGAAGSRYITIPVTIKARTTSGKDQTFKGEYVLRRSVVDGATEAQRAWKIYSAKIRPA